MKKWMYVVTGVVVVAAVMAVILGVRFLAPERPAVENGVPASNGDVVDNGVDGIPDVAAATSIRFSVERTNAEKAEYTYSAKDIGTQDFRSRIDGQAEGLEVRIIINGELRQAWVFQDAKWVEVPDQSWNDYWEGALSELDLYICELEGCTNGDCIFAHPEHGYQVRIYDIEVDPDLSDALFKPPVGAG